ncbi:type II secretion system ATPase GspE [Thermodesulfobacteriota bacterium]
MNRHGNTNSVGTRDEDRKIDMPVLPEVMNNGSHTPLIVRQDDMKEEERLETCSKSLNIPFKKHILDDLNFEHFNEIPIQYLKRMAFVPLYLGDGTLNVAVNDPLNYQAVDDLARRLGGRTARMVLSPLKEIHSAINLLYDQSSEDAEKMVQDLGDYQSANQVFSELEEMEDLMDVMHDAPIIRLVNIILTQALRRHASDIHIESYEREIKIRFRMDGVLYEIFSIPRRFQAHIVSRLKVMANLDIAEKRIPQDGRMKIKVADKMVDIRISIIPMAFGERIVLRLLDKSISLLGLEEMGLVEAKLKSFERLINKNNGILLVTGPTGSGKTTTLYAALNRINSIEKNIITIEDPIEYELKGIGQIQVNQKTELNFARGMRSILRHDPDIIMVGEIRDHETVEIAIQASLTGHLVFSTLHTNDAASAVTRLVDMGVEPFLIASSLLAVEAQRLVRKICPDCKESYLVNKATRDDLGLPGDMAFYKGRGCPSCFESGYRGRTGIFELLEIDNEIRRLVTSGADSVTIKEAAMGNGMITMFEDGLEKVRKGITTLDEVMRVTQE